jgi:predicted acylesterase/phospholipase RssA
MTGAANTAVPAKTEIGLVLQGGGALGAYEWGAITALFDVIHEAIGSGQDITLRVVTGVSIGAINAACVVGAADRADARNRLGAMWGDFMIDLPYLPPSANRDLALYNVPHFYTYRSDLLAAPTWTYLYETHQLLETLSEHVDFDALNANKTAFVITAVDVASGVLTRFTNQKVGDTEPTTIEPHHVLASGSIPPQFPWTDISAGDGNVCHYWDGGIVDNTPLGDAIDAFSSDPGVTRLLVVMNLFPQTASLPRSLTQVNERLDQLRFGNRLRQDSSTARQMNALIATIQDLSAFLSGPLPDDLQKRVDKANAYKLVKLIEISLTADAVTDDPNSFRDFSRDGIVARRDAGRRIALSALRPTFHSQLAA